jgi:hypothetical protein
MPDTGSGELEREVETEEEGGIARHRAWRARHATVGRTNMRPLFDIVLPRVALG